MTIVFYTAIFFFLFLSILLCMIILIQESKSMGLGASFGGEPGESLFGTSTAAVLKKFTAYLAVIFVLSCIFLSIWSASIGKTKKPPPVQIEQLEQ